MGKKKSDFDRQKDYNKGREHAREGKKQEFRSKDYRDGHSYEKSKKKK